MKSECPGSLYTQTVNICMQDTVMTAFSWLQKGYTTQKCNSHCDFNFACMCVLPCCLYQDPDCLWTEAVYQTGGVNPIALEALIKP